MDEKSCFFIGHREADERLLPELLRCVERLVTEEGVAYFYVGNHGGFDRIAAAAVKKTREKYTGITLMMVLSYHPGEHSVELPQGFDGLYYPTGLEKVPKRFAVARANKLMVDSCEWLVAYAYHGASNSRNLLEYAENKSMKGLIHIERLERDQ